MKKYIIITFATLLFASCGGEYIYPQDKGISNKEGALEDSVQQYLLSQIEYDGTTHTFEWNQERLEELNGYFKRTSEPALYNYYLKRKIYRLILVEKEKAPLLFSVNRDEKGSWISSKKLEGDISNPSDSSETALILSTASNFKNYSRVLKEEEMQNFDSLFIATDFFHLTSEDAVKESYDNYCLIEAHEDKKYWYVYRPLDDASLKEVVEYIRSLSGF